MTTVAYLRERCNEVRASGMACDLRLGVPQEVAARENGTWSVPMKVSELEAILDHAEAQERAVQQAQVEVLRAGVAELEAKKLAQGYSDGAEWWMGAAEWQRKRTENALASLRRVAGFLVESETSNTRLLLMSGIHAFELAAERTAHAETRAALVEAVKSMVEDEWKLDEYDRAFCGACGSWRSDGHDADCWRLLTIAAARAALAKGGE